jgi:hypothetical protein
VTGRMIKQMAKELTLIIMAHTIREAGKTTCKTEKELKFGPMDQDIKEYDNYVYLKDFQMGKKHG